MVAAKRIRWECPNGLHPAALGPRRPRRDDIVRYCLRCSETSGRLVERLAPVLERQREAAAARTKAKAATKRRASQRAAAAKVARETERFTVEGVDLRDEMARYAKLPEFAATFRRRGLPEFTVRHWQHAPNQRGWASPWEWRIHLALWEDAPLRMVRQTLVHELAHLHVGQVGGKGGEWHGTKFRASLHRALVQAGLKDQLTIETMSAGR